MNPLQAAARTEPPHLLLTDGPSSDEHADTEAALSWLARHFAMNDRLARVLLGQAAHQDGVSEVEAARRLIRALGDEAHRADTWNT